MKRIIFLILALVLCLCTVQTFADGEGYASISTAYIDYTPIDSYIISDITYIEVENLANYGFDVAFDETAQSYNVSRIKFATPMYTREMWKEEASVKTDIKTETGNVKVYLDGQLANSYCANGKKLVQFDELQKYGKVVWNDYYRKLNVYIFREEMQNELDNAENVVEIEIGKGTYKGQVDENNQPHGIGCWTDDHDYEGKFEYLGYFTHSKPDGLMYKKTYRTVSRSYVARSTYFIGKVDGSKEAERRYEYVEPEMKYDEYYGWVKVKEGYNILVGRDANFGVAHLPEKEIPTFYGYEDDFYDIRNQNIALFKSIVGNPLRQYVNEARLEIEENADYSLIEFNVLNINDESSINAVLYNADNVLQYFESQDPKEDVYEQAEREMKPVDEEMEYE